VTKAVLRLQGIREAQQDPLDVEVEECSVIGEHAACLDRRREFIEGSGFECPQEPRLDVRLLLDLIKRQADKLPTLAQQLANPI
jgi:hypothetical protein